MTLEEVIAKCEERVEMLIESMNACDLDDTVEKLIARNDAKCADEQRQLAEWLKILKSAQFEYHEAWRIITHPTPDVTYADRDRAQVVLDTFRDSLGRMDDANNNLHV